MVAVPCADIFPSPRIGHELAFRDSRHSCDSRSIQVGVGNVAVNAIRMNLDKSVQNNCQSGDTIFPSVRICLRS